MVVFATIAQASSAREHALDKQLLPGQKNTFFQSIVSALNIPFIILDSRFRVYYQNDLFLKKFNYKDESIRGKLLFKLEGQQWDNEHLKKELKETLEQNRDLNNFELQFENHQNMVLNANCVAKGNRKFILVTLQDITEIKRKQHREKEILKHSIQVHESEKQKLEKAVKRRTKQLEMKNLELARANKELESFNYISSHDLQEPLRKIQNLSSLILKEERKHLSKTGKDYFKRMQLTAHRMQSLIEDLLAYSRTKNAERKFENTDLNELLDEVREEYEEKILEKKGEIVASKLCTAPVIRFQFRQLLHNLFSNSLKFTIEGRAPIIRIRASIASGADLEYNKLNPKTRYCHITFSDNGIGFDPQYSERIFEVFQRLHTVKEYKGTGIGLAICKRIVENHNGFITASGKINKGARFDIYFPLNKL